MAALYWLILSILAVWRLTHLLVHEDGPFDSIVLLRKRLGEGTLGRMMDCFYCMSLWIALPFSAGIGHTWFETLTLWLAASAGAIILQSLTHSEAALGYRTGYRTQTRLSDKHRNYDKITPLSSTVPQTFSANDSSSTAPLTTPIYWEEREML